MIQGRTFEEVMHEVTTRADRALPDAVVHVADLRMDRDGRLVTPDGSTYRLNDWSRRGLATLVGIKWSRWFGSATPDERAEEINRRLARLPGEKKLRAWRDDTGAADGVAQALLAPSFTPIDDERIFTRFAVTLRGTLAEYRFTRVNLTDATTHYTAVHVDGLDIAGDVLHPGWHLRNSEVGGAALSIDDFWLRLVCTNGLLVQVGGKRLLYRTHRGIEDDTLAALVAVAFSHLPERWGLALDLLQRARDAAVPHPDAAVAAVLDSPEIPKALMEEAQRIALKDNDRTRFGVVQAITYVAHATNSDPDVRFAMERLAGSYLAAATEMAA